MPQIAVYIPKKSRIKLIEAGESKSKTVQNAQNCILTKAESHLKKFNNNPFLIKRDTLL